MIPNRPVVLVIILLFTFLSNLFVLSQTLNWGFKSITPIVAVFNLLLPLLLMIAVVSLWNKKRWGWWLFVMLTGANIVSEVGFIFTLPVNLYIPYLLDRGVALILGAIVFYYLFNKKVLTLVLMPIKARGATLKQSLGFSVAGGLLLLLVMILLE